MATPSTLTRSGKVTGSEVQKFPAWLVYRLKDLPAASTMDDLPALTAPGAGHGPAPGVLLSTAVALQAVRPGLHHGALLRDAGGKRQQQGGDAGGGDHPDLPSLRSKAMVHASSSFTSRSDGRSIW